MIKFLAIAGMLCTFFSGASFAQPPNYGSPLLSGGVNNVTAYGARCDGQILYGGLGVTSGSPVVTPQNIGSGGHSFVAADVGALITLSVPPFNSFSSAPLTSFSATIASVANGKATLTNNVNFTSSNAAARWYKTDDTTAIQNALNASTANNLARGAVVQFPNGVCVTRQLTLGNNTRIQGTSYGGSTVMLANAANTSMFVGNNFATLTGSNSTGGLKDWGFKDIQLDGNRGANTGSGAGTAGAIGDGIQVYGYEPFMDNVFINNFAADGMYTEWSSSAGSPVDANGNIGPDGMEAHIHDLKCAYGAGWCYVFNGPHDSIVSYMTTISMGAGGLLQLGTANASPISIDHFHGYQEPTDLNLQSGVDCIKCFSEGKTILNGFYYSLVDSAFGTLQVGVTGGGTVYQLRGVNTTVNTFNNVTGSGFQDQWINGRFGTFTGNSYSASLSLNNIGLPSSLGNVFQMTNGPSYPAIFNQSTSSQFTLTNQGATQWTNTGSGTFFNTTIGATLPTSAGSGGLNVCVDSSGNFYKKSSCP